MTTARPKSPPRDRSHLLVATRSTHKLRELRELLGLRAELIDLDDVGIDAEVEEDGETFEANAAKKARYFASLSGLPTLADDSGLEVDALGGGPGVRTKRYSGENATPTIRSSFRLPLMMATIVLSKSSLLAFIKASLASTSSMRASSPAPRLARRWRTKSGRSRISLISSIGEL